MPSGRWTHPSPTSSVSRRFLVLGAPSGILRRTSTCRPVQSGSGPQTALRVPARSFSWARPERYLLTGEEHVHVRAVAEAEFHRIACSILRRERLMDGPLRLLWLGLRDWFPSLQMVPTALI